MSTASVQYLFHRGIRFAVGPELHECREWKVYLDNDGRGMQGLGRPLGGQHRKGSFKIAVEDAERSIDEWMERSGSKTG